MSEEINAKNTKEEKFLIVFQPEYVNIDAFFCFTLKNGIKLLTLFTLWNAGINFIETVAENTIIYRLFSFVLFILYVKTAIYLFISAVNLNYKYANVSYNTYEIVVIMNCMYYVILIILMCFGLYTPYNKDGSFIARFVSFLIESIVVMLVCAYFLWIMFSFMVLLNENRIKVVLGEEYTKIVANNVYENNVNVRNDEQQNLLEI